MRKSVIFLFAAMGLLAGCAKEVAQDTLSEKVTLQVGIAPATRTHMGDLADGAHKVYWSDGDKIAVNGVASEALAEVGDAATQANFSFDALEGAPYNVLYPADIWADATHVTLPAVQTYQSGGFADGMFPMAAYSADGIGIAMKHLCAVVKVNVLRALDGDDDKLVAVRFQGNANEQVSGSFSINYADATLSGASSAAADKVVKVVKVLTTATDKAVSYYIVVPAITYSAGFSIIVQDASGDAQTVIRASSATLEAGKLYNMAEFSFVPNGTAPATLEIASAEDLIAFATAYNNKEYEGQDDLVVELTQDITFNATQSAAFNATGGIGMMNGVYGGEENFYFNGLFKGNNHSINGLAANVPVFAATGKNGCVQNLTLGATSSVTYSGEVSRDLYLGGIVGMSRGRLENCVNNAPVSCTSSSYGAPIYIGGVVGYVVSYNPVSYCVNNADVTCSVGAGSERVCMGGIAGVVQCEGSSDKSVVSHCTNHGKIFRSDLTADNKSATHYLGGVIGWLCASYSASHTHSYLVNDGDVIGPNYQTATNKIPQLVGGLIGAIHASGSDISVKAKVVLDHCSVSNCEVKNMFRNNGSDGGTGGASYTKQCHNGGLIGAVRGGAELTDIQISNCSVEGVSVFSTRGFSGGLCGYSRGATINNCKVLATAVDGAQVFFGGGITACSYDAKITNCQVSLTTLHTKGAKYYTGGITGWADGTSVTIENSEAFISSMNPEGSGVDGVRGWIAGYCSAAATSIKNCGLGGSLASPAVTLNGSNYESYIYGSSSTGVSAQSCYYWDGTL